ncbi:hypothetical protein L0Y65_04465 [Candidatus Micrarchaeota archaeon]|nr:hypothetical protein [Candidatus Micrarchaeota archaeon]
MRRSIVLLLAIFLLGFGCLGESPYQGGNAEAVASAQPTDLDGDGSADYIVYGFSPATYKGAGMIVQRQVTVTAETASAYTSITPNLTDVDLLIADQSLDEFSKSRIQADTACSQAIGLSNVVCSDVTTCVKLCTSASQKCRNIAAGNEEILAGSMISYVKANNEIRSLLLDSRRIVITLREGTPEERDEFLGKTRQIINRIAEINANPLYSSGDFLLCSYSDFGIPYMLDAAHKVGQYETQNSGYRYHVLISVKPAASGNAQDIGVEISGLGITDKIPANLVLDTESISSMQAISASESGGYSVVNWTSAKSNEAGYALYYEFQSEEPPESVIGGMRTPEIHVKTINLVPLAPTNMILVALNGALGNYYLAFGAATGITLAALLFVYNIVILLFTMLSERVAGASLTTGFRKAFGRTDVRWKADIVVAAVMLAAGYYLSTTVAMRPAAMPPLLESVDFLMKSDMGLIAIGVTLVGVLMTYFAIENFVKITILERAYGMVIRQEKDMFLAKAGALKDRIKELESLVEEYSKEDFDVSKEYDVLTTVKSEKIDLLAKDMTARSKALIDDYLTRVDNAVSSLKGRKKLADENWPRWKEAIEKMLNEQNEVYISSLVTVPASLRGWALGKFAKEAGVEGLSFERDVIKKRKVSPDQLVLDMLGKGLLRGAIVMKQDKVVLAEFAEGGGTVMTALGLKLMSYMRTLARNLGQHQPQSFAAIGDKTVIVVMRSRMLDSILFISKDKFKDAVEQWKAKMKIFESG